MNVWIWNAQAITHQPVNEGKHVHPQNTHLYW
jgi:hypothetical protein